MSPWRCYLSLVNCPALSSSMLKKVVILWIIRDFVLCLYTMFFLAFYILCRSRRCHICLKPWSKIRLGLLSEKNHNFILFAFRQHNLKLTHFLLLIYQPLRFSLLSRYGIWSHWICSYLFPLMRIHSSQDTQPSMCVHTCSDVYKMDSLGSTRLWRCCRNCAMRIEVWNNEWGWFLLQAQVTKTLGRVEPHESESCRTEGFWISGLHVQWNIKEQM